MTRNFRHMSLPTVKIRRPRAAQVAAVALLRVEQPQRAQRHGEAELELAEALRPGLLYTGNIR